jgi:hypothetical protein
VRELLSLDFLLIGTDSIALELYTEFRAHRDRPGFSAGPLRAGDVHRCTNMVHYDLVDGGFAAIRVGRYQVWGPDERGEPKVFPGIGDRDA